ncbi:hypothetical protein E6O75_ATG11216 [Venturia nashicola]|uniref:Mitochondrial carrier n=1 Tax=Venturia nashicola TaxID=86259 RepID=A0A4Z1PJR8_9PEZI|nr:hypothetical protein E6O75_ATG11216 [Venturia nashicola]
MKEADASTPPIVSLIAGGTAGGIEATLTYPFEYAKTRVQLRGEHAPKNPFAVVGKLRSESCTGRAGMGFMAKDAIRFMSFDAVKEAFKDPATGTLSPLRNILAGMASGVVASTLAVTPTERLKTALIDDARTEKRFKSAWHATKILVKEKGFIALYRGYITTTAKQMGTTSVRLGSYNIMKDYGKLHNWPESSFVDFGKGMVAGTVTTYVTQPIDVVKTRAQSVKGAGVVEATMSVWQDYGIKGFWRGTVMRLGRTVMAGGILFTSYEQIVTLVKPLVGTKEREET